MSVIGAAKDQIVGLVGRIVDGTHGGSAAQTVTVACTTVAAEDFWRDSRRVSAALGELGYVTFTEPNVYVWRFYAGDVPLKWRSRLVADDARLRFVSDTETEILIGLRQAPNHLGTEMTLRASLPVPGLLAGAAAFRLLYRVRALIQTGEAPTLARNPDGR